MHRTPVALVPGRKSDLMSPFVLRLSGGDSSSPFVRPQDMASHISDTPYHLRPFHARPFILETVTRKKLTDWTRRAFSQLPDLFVMLQKRMGTIRIFDEYLKNSYENRHERVRVRRSTFVLSKLFCAFLTRTILAARLEFGGTSRNTNARHFFTQPFYSNFQLKILTEQSVKWAERYGTISMAS